MGITYPAALLLGLALAGVPTLIHFLARSRPVRLRYPTVRFLVEAIKHRRSLFRFRDMLVLCLRILAIVFLAAAFARLFSLTRSAIALEGEEPTVRVILLDASRSMQARRNVVQVFDLAKSTAAKYVAFRSNLRAAVVVCAATASPLLDRVSDNLTELSAALSAARPRDEALDVSEALTAAARIFNESEEGSTGGPVRRELIIVSDFQRTNWGNAPVELIGADVSWRFDQVGLTGEVGNLAVCDVNASVLPRPGEAVQLVIDVGNFSQASQRANVELRVQDALWTAQAVCAPWETSQAVVSLPAETVQALNSSSPGGQGRWLCGTARIVDAEDVLPADDERPFVIPIAEPRRIVFLSREDAAEVGTSRYFLDRALSAGSDDEVKVLDPARPDTDLLAEADLIVVAQAGRLPAETVRLLSALATRGGSLLFVTAEARDAESLDAMVEACGEHLQLPVTFVPETRPSRSTRHLEWIGGDQRPFKLLSGKAESLRALEFSGGVSSLQRSGQRPEEVLATFEDGSAAVVAASCGRGRVGVLNAEVAESSLPASAFFVPLVQELAARLTEASEHRAVAVAVGRPVNMFLPASTSTARETSVEGPAGASGAAGSACGTFEDTDTGVLWSWHAVESPGIYRVRQNGRIAHTLAAVCGEGESDLRTMDPALLGAGVPGARAVEVARTSTEAREPERHSEWWPWLMLAAFGCLVAELAVLKLFRT